MVTSTQQHIIELLDRDGAVSRRRHPDLARGLLWLVESGRLTAALPGVYVRTSAAHDLRTRIRALQQADPNAVLTGRAAAFWSFWPEIRVDALTAAVQTKRISPCGFRFERRAVPADLIADHEDSFLTSPALTALDLVDDLGGDGIDQVLRLRIATLDDLHNAFGLTRSRRGNGQRLQTLLDSRDEPWARSERLLFRLLHDAGITGWCSNLPLRLPEGQFFLDAAFEEAMLAIEVDGWEFHARRPQDFDATMRKHSALESAGWRVLHFTWNQLVDHPDWVIKKIVEALACCARENRPVTRRHARGHRAA